MTSGLSRRTAISLTTSKIIHADYATKKDGPFYCPECFSDAIVRKCKEKEDHFAHKGRSSILYKSGETELHNNCKDEILAQLKEVFPNGNWEKERPIKENKEKNLAALVPDLSGRINNKPVVIEIQRSFLNVNKIIHRTVEYTKRKVAILWIVPLKQDLGQELFRPRLFEKFLHSMYFSRTYYWRKGFGAKVIPTHFAYAERWIEEKTWFNIGNHEVRTEGGFWKQFKTIRQPIPSDLIDIAKDFEISMADEWQPDNEELKIPERLILKDKLKKWWSDEATR